MRVLFRVDAGKGAGLGHLTRCLALARALSDAGAECIFLTSREVQERVERAGFTFLTLDDTEDLLQTIMSAQQNECRVIVVDSYHVGADYLAQLRDAGFYVVMLDDLAAFPFPNQLVVNGSIYAGAKEYISASKDTHFLLGTKYILLREEFWNVTPRPLRPSVQTILILLGGMDPLNLMPRLIQQLDTLAGDFQITVVIGPFFENRSEVEQAAKRAMHCVEWVFNPSDTRELILGADAAISAGGQTIHELLVCGCPTLALAIAENQVPNVGAWAERDAVLRVTGAQEKISFDEVRQAMQKLIGSCELREKLRANGRQWIDGAGTQRVAQEILNEC